MWTSLGFVGSVGIRLILGGGRGPNHRLYGLSADQIVEVEYVDWRGRNRVRLRRVTFSKPPVLNVSPLYFKWRVDG